MKVFNISDVKTPFLVERGMFNASIKVGDMVLPPGTSADVHRKYRAEAMRFVGALAFDQLPVGYQGKARPKPKKKVDTVRSPELPKKSFERTVVKVDSSPKKDEPTREGKKK